MRVNESQAPVDIINNFILFFVARYLVPTTFLENFMFLVKKAVSVFIALFVLVSLPSVASTTVVDNRFESEPHQIVQDVTVKVIDAVESGDLDSAKDPDAFVETLSEILDPVVAFEFIARQVMGNYSKSVSAEQISQFSRSFKLGLVNTYGKGVSGFDDLTITVLAPAPDAAPSRRVSVIQELKTPTGKNEVTYIMGQNKKKEWKMINIYLNGVNLGSTFRTQFAATVKKNNGDVVKTINEWGKS